MKICVLLSVIFISFVCKGQEIKLSDISISVYPSSGGEVGYFIKVEKGILEVSSKKLKVEGNDIVLGSTISTKRINLSKRQSKRIACYVSELRKLQDVKRSSNDLILDVWLVDFFIEEKQEIRTNSKDLGNNSEFSNLKKVFKYLIKISPLDVELKGFS